MSPGDFIAGTSAAFEFGQNTTGIVGGDWVTGIWNGLRPVSKEKM